MYTTIPTLMPSPSKPVVPSLFAGKAWQQVLERDPHADGQFVYAVKSTKIYCRPTCPSRRPDRKNVTFFPGPAAAQAAGYRACLRCEPDLAAPRPDPQAAALAHVTEYLTEHANERTKLKDVAKATGIPRLTILRGFKRVLGLTPTQFAKSQRLDRFRKELHPKAGASRTPAAPVTDAIYEVGYGSSSRLYENSAATLGMTPSALRRGAPALTITYILAASPLGRILVAATDRGICAISFADDDAALRSDLAQRFPKANLLEDPTGHASTNRRPQASWLAESVAYVLSQLTEHPTAATFPLDIRATAFQQRVWQALQRIPRGQTRTYSEVARELDRPTAARAVASACGANPVALLHPCHRVVGADGKLTGYRWGLDRKRRLLANEAQQASRAGAAEAAQTLA